MAPLPPGSPPARRGPGNPVSEFMAGIHDVWRGAGLLLRRPTWWPWAVLPFLVNAGLFALLLWLGFMPLKNWAQAHLFQAGGFWSGLLGGMIYLLFWLIAAVVVFFVFAPVATIVAAPFNDFLSEKVELDYRGVRVEKQSFVRDTWRAIWVGLVTSVRQSLVVLVLYLVILPLWLLPVIGHAIYAVLSTLITIRFLALQFTAYSMDRRFYNYEQRKQFLKRHRWRSIGLGAMAFGLMLIPVVNALFIAAFAVAGTLLFCDTELEA